MGRKKFKLTKSGAAIVLLSMTLLGAFVYLGYDYINKQSTQDVSSGTFTLITKDMLASQKLTNSRFDYTLYGLPIGDPATDPLAWEIIETGTSLDNIKNADLDTSLYSAFYVVYNGSELQATYDDQLGTRTFPARQQPVYANAANVLEAYAQPAGISLDVKNSNTGVAITNTTATPIVCQTNVTFVIGEYAAFKASYKSYWSYSSNAMVRPGIVLNYNDTVTTSTALSIAGTTMTRVNATAFIYGFSSILDILSFPALWPEAAVSHQIDSCYLDWDGSELAQLVK